MTPWLPRLCKQILSASSNLVTTYQFTRCHNYSLVHSGASPISEVEVYLLDHRVNTVFVISRAKLKFIQERTGQRRPARFIQLFARYAHQVHFERE
jgi:hypothetical protein